MSQTIIGSDQFPTSLQVPQDTELVTADSVVPGFGGLLDSAAFLLARLTGQALPLGAPPGFENGGPVVVALRALNTIRASGFTLHTPQPFEGPIYDPPVASFPDTTGTDAYDPPWVLDNNGLFYVNSNFNGVNSGARLLFPLRMPAGATLTNIKVGVQVPGASTVADNVRLRILVRASVFNTALNPLETYTDPSSTAAEYGAYHVIDWDLASPISVLSLAAYWLEVRADNDGQETRVYLPPRKTYTASVLRPGGV